MSIVNSIIKLFVGDKQQKDLKSLQPVVDKVKSFENALTNLSNDELREKTISFKSKIQEATQTFTDEIAKLEAEIKTAEIDIQEKLYAEIDGLKDQAYDASEKVLEEIMPEAFAVVKETARRFATNEKLEVTATPFDRELSGIHEHVELDDDKAYWYNSWDASGKEVTWDMIHYDVQLIGGSVLHLSLIHI